MGRPPLRRRHRPLSDGVDRVTNLSAGTGRPWRAVAWAVAIVFLVALAIRLYLLTRVPERYIIPHHRWEIEAIAWSLVENGRFADPYAVPTGPTAHVPPLYPLALSGVWRIFGLGASGGYAGWIMGLGLAALQCALIPWFAVRLGLGLAPGIMVGVGCAVLPAWPSHVEPPAAILLGLLMLAFRRRWVGESPTLSRSLLLGAGAGVAFHLQPVLLSVVAGFLAFELWRIRDPRRWTAAGAVLLGALVVCLPWAWRNYSTMHGIFFIRSNFGLELLVGNHPGAKAEIDDMLNTVTHLHPRTSVEQARRVRDLGEVAFMRAAGAEARGWIAANPWTYARLSAERALAFWCRTTEELWYAVPATLVTLLGALGAARLLPRRSEAERAVLLVPLIMFPPVYYFVDYLPRYRLPVIWVLYLFAAAEVWYRLRRGAPTAPAESRRAA